MFRNEPFITQRQGKRGWSFQVFIRNGADTITKTFSERNYGSARLAFDSAVLFKNKTLTEIAEGTVLKKSNITVKECVDLFMETTVLSFSTQEKHYKLMNKYIKSLDVPIQSLTKAHIIADLNAMVDVATDDTINRVLSIYRTDIIGVALNNDLITRDLTLGLKPPKSHVYRKRKDTTTNKETLLKVENILLNSMNNKYDAKIICYMLDVLYYTGMRPAECEVLTVNDIHENYISINKELGSNRDKKDVVRRCKTEDSVRNVPISPSLKPILEELISFSKYEELFKRENGEYFNSTSIGQFIRERIRGTNIKFNMYMLRHNVATQLVTNKVDEKTTMELLGHRNFSMSLYYANSNEDLKKDAINLLN